MCLLCCYTMRKKAQRHVTNYNSVTVFIQLHGQACRCDSHFPRFLPTFSLFHPPTFPICPLFLHSSLTTDPLSPCTFFLFFFCCPSPSLYSSLPSLSLLHFSPSPPFFLPLSLSLSFCLFLPFLHVSITPQDDPSDLRVQCYLIFTM